MWQLIKNPRDHIKLRSQHNQLEQNDFVPQLQDLLTELSKLFKWQHDHEPKYGKLETGDKYLE